jgi:cytoskeleton protein RodZ
MAMNKWKQHVPEQKRDDAAQSETADIVSANDARGHGTGGLLRSTREGLGWNLRDVAASLRIRADYLDALERNTVEGLPGPTYATGFLKAYAEFLGLDGQEIVRRFRAEKTGLHAKAELAFPVPLTDRGIPGGGILLIAVLLAGLLGTWYYLPTAQHPAPAPIEAVPTRLLPPPPTPVAVTEPSKPADTAANALTAPAPTAAPATVAAAPPTVTAAPPTTPPQTASAAAAPAAETDSEKPAGHLYGGPTPGRIVILGTGKAWVTVKDGAKPILNTLFNKGDSYNVPDRDGLTLKTGSAGSLTITLDGKALAPLGPVGLVRTVPLDPDKLAGLPPPG